MAESNPPSPEEKNKEIARFTKAIDQATARDIAAFKSAARKAAQADADDLAAEYAAYSKAISEESVRLFEQTLLNKTARPLMKAKIATLKAEALKALSHNRSKRMATLLDQSRFFRCGVGSEDVKPRANGKPPKCPSDRHNPPGDRRDHGDMHVDGVDD